MAVHFAQLLLRVWGTTSSVVALVCDCDEIVSGVVRELRIAILLVWACFVLLSTLLRT